MELVKINYDELSGRQKKIYDIHKAASVLAEYGFNCSKLSDSWQLADFQADHINGDQPLKVILKRRMLIDRKYIGKNLYMCFRIGGTWHLIPHDELVRIVEEILPATFDTLSWERGTYSWPRPPKRIREILSRYALDAK